MAAAGVVPKLRFTPSLSSKPKACAIPWIALLLPQLGTSLLGAVESKAGGEIPSWKQLLALVPISRPQAQSGAISPVHYLLHVYSYHTNPLEKNKAFLTF